MDPNLSPELVAFHRKANAFLALCIISCAISTYIGWAFNIEWMRSILPGFSSMNPLTAAMFIFSASSVLMLRSENTLSRRYKTGQLLAVYIALMGFARVVSLLSDVYFPFDKILFASKLNGNHMALNTSLCFCLCGLSLRGLDWEIRKGWRPMQGALFFVFCMALMVVVGDLYGVAAFTSVRSIGIAMALNTAICFIALSVAIFWLRPNKGLMRVFCSRRFGGLTVRRLMPVAIFAPIFLGYMRLRGELAGYYGVQVSAASYAISTLVISACVILWVSWTTDRMDRERADAEDKAQKQKAVLESVIFNLSEGLVVADKFGNFTLFNPAAEMILGIGRTEAASNEWSKEYGLFHPDGHPFDESEIPLVRAIRGGSVDNVEMIVRNPSIPQGTTISVSGRPIYDKVGELIGGVVVFRDIADRKKAELAMAHARDVAMESARFKSEFMANMSHEIRTPMNAIIGMASLLMDTKLDTKQRQFAQIVMNAGETLLSLINDILDFSKIEAGKFVLESNDVDIRSSVEDVLMMLADKAQAKGVELASFVPNDLPSLVYGDPHRLRQVMTNLIGNAVKFTEKGEVVVRVSQERADTEMTWLRFHIRDTGVGIPEEVRGKLFQAFQQADGSTTRKFGGTGLGLAISKRLVELMGGEIGMNSEVSKGSEFWFTIPFKKHPGRPTAMTPPKHELAGLRVLIVDDNETNREILHHQVTSWGMKSASAKNGAEALGILQRETAAGEPYALAILDMQMPGMDGLSLAQAIKADPAIARTHLIIMTSLGNQTPQKTLRAAGVSSCLTKPVRQSELYNCLVSVLESTQPVTQRVVRVKARKADVHKARILVAEDNKVNQEVIVFQLEKLGYRADLVSTGAEAVDTHTRQPYDLILMDCQMPDMDGYAATREIRNRESDGKSHVMIIAMTANALEGDRQRCLAAGMDEYISKPVSLAKLKSLLETTLAGVAAAMPLAAPTPIAPPVPIVQLVDMVHLREATDHDEPGMRRLVGIYLHETALELDHLEAAFQAGKAEEVHRIAHGCKGASAAYGMSSLAALLKDIEFQGRENRLNETAASLRQARATFEQVQMFWKSYLEGSPQDKAA